MEGLDPALMDDVPMPTAPPILIGPNPFNWLYLLTSESNNGLSLSTVFLSLFRATQSGHGSEFGKFLDDMPHLEDDHTHEGPCFRCLLKDLEVESYYLPTVEDQASYFVRTFCKWYYEPDDYSLFTRLHDSLELWSVEKPGWYKQFFKLFSVQTHDKDGCRDCFEHFSEPKIEYLFDAGEKSIQQFIQQTTREARRLCSGCGHPTRYDRKSFRNLPMCLVFTKTGVPLPDIQYRGVPYKLTVVVPVVEEFKVYMLSKNEWEVMDLKENKLTMMPLDVIDEWSVLELVFYTKVMVRGGCQGSCCNAV